MGFLGNSEQRFSDDFGLKTQNKRYLNTEPNFFSELIKHFLKFYYNMNIIIIMFGLYMSLEFGC